MKYLAIGEICELLNGFAFKSKEYTNEGIRIIRIANVQKGYIEDSAPCYYPEVQLPTFKKSMLSTGDLLISLTGNVGRVGLLPESMIPAALNQRVGCLRVKNDHEMDIKYLFHLLNSDYFENACIESSNGAAQKNLSTNWLKEFLIPIPSLVEQKAIARVFEYIVLLLELEKRRVDYFDDLVKSRFVEMFGNSEWPRETIGDIATDIRYGTSRKASESGKYVYLRMNNLTDDGHLDFSDVKAIDLDDDELEKCMVMKGDLLFNRTNSREKVGKTAVFLEDVPMVIAGYIIRVRLSSKMDSEFLVQFMNLPTTKAMLRSMAKGAVHQANINSKELAGIKVPVPPISLQQEFITFVHQVDKLKFETRQSIEKLQMLYDSLAQEYFAPEGD